MTSHHTGGARGEGEGQEGGGAWGLPLSVVQGEGVNRLASGSMATAQGKRNDSNWTQQDKHSTQQAGLCCKEFYFLNLFFFSNVSGRLQK